MSRSLHVRALMSLLPLLGVGTLAATPAVLVTRHPGTQICHHASIHEGREMWVDDAALDGHMQHGDNFGACPTGTGM